MGRSPMNSDNDKEKNITGQIRTKLSDIISASQVVGHDGKSKKLKFLWLIVAVSIVLFFSLFWLLPDGAKKSTGQTFKQLNYQEELNRNLAKLHDVSKKIVTMNRDVQKNIMKKNGRVDKKFLIRQNAPTNIYINNKNSVKNSSEHAYQLFDASDAGRFSNQVLKKNARVYRMAHPQSTVASGEFIHAELETAIDSDLPGLVRAVVTSPVYSYVKDVLLIGKGSRLIGQYSSSVLRGQRRILVVWNKIILPDGVVVNVNSQSTDVLGRVGQHADNIDTHFVQRFRSAVLLSLLGAGASTVGVSNGDQYNSAAQYRSVIAASLQQSARQSLQGSVSIKPTLHIYQGAQINVFVAHDLDFYNLQQHQL